MKNTRQSLTTLVLFFNVYIWVHIQLQSHFHVLCPPSTDKGNNHFSVLKLKDTSCIEPNYKLSERLSCNMNGLQFVCQLTLKIIECESRKKKETHTPALTHKQEAMEWLVTCIYAELGKTFGWDGGACNGFLKYKKKTHKSS